MRRQRVTKPDEEPSSSQDLEQQESPPLDEEKIDKIELQMQQTTEIREMTQDILQLTTEEEVDEKNQNVGTTSPRKAAVVAPPPRTRVVIDADTTTRSAIERNPVDSVETTTTKPQPTSKGYNSSKKEKNNGSSVLSKAGAKVGETYGAGTKTSMRTKQAKGQNQPGNTRLARNTTIGAMAIDGPGFEDDAPPANSSVGAAQRTSDSNGVVTLTATAVEDDDAVEQRVRRQILDQAVEAEVLGSDASSSGSVELPHDDEEARKDLAPPPRRSRRCLWIAALVIFLLAGGVAGGIAGAALAVKNKGNNNKPPPPPPKEENGGGGGGGGGGGSNGGGGDGKDKDGDDKDKDGGGGGGGMMQNRRSRRQLLPNDLPPLPLRQVRKNQEMSGVSSETSMVGLRGQHKQPHVGGRRR